MGKLTRKCDYCKLDDTNKDDMEMETKVGKKNTYKYYHKNCYPRHLQRQEFLKREREELDHLTEVIMTIYGVKVLPNSIYPTLQDLRNGNKFYGKKQGNYKQGYTYKTIADTFEYVSDSIEWANANKSFSGFTQAFRYGLAIVCDKLMVVENRNRSLEQQKKMAEARSNVSVDADDYEPSFQKKKDDTSIMDFLDD